jgi:hypothetical protein
MADIQPFTSHRHFNGELCNALEELVGNSDNPWFDLFSLATKRYPECYDKLWLVGRGDNGDYGINLKNIDSYTIKFTQLKLTRKDFTNAVKMGYMNIHYGTADDNSVIGINYEWIEDEHKFYNCVLNHSHYDVESLLGSIQNSLDTFEQDHEEPVSLDNLEAYKVEFLKATDVAFDRVKNKWIDRKQRWLSSE